MQEMLVPHEHTYKRDNTRLPWSGEGRRLSVELGALTTTKGRPCVIIKHITGSIYVHEVNYTNTGIRHKSDTCSLRHLATNKYKYTKYNYNRRIQNIISSKYIST